MTETRDFLNAMLAGRGGAPAATKWMDEARAEIAAGVADARFANLISLASRYGGRGLLEPTAEERAEAARLLPGWNPERWTRLEAVRVSLVLSRPDLDRASAVTGVEGAFLFADMGELCALYRALAHLPSPERFVWRAGEGCRTNMTAVFEAVACDTPFPAEHLDDVAWRQLVIKAIFVGAPVWRVFGLDGRLDAELARMALDLMDERHSAGRTLQPELWLCLGEHAGERGLAALERELAGSYRVGRKAAAIGLARAGRTERLAELAEAEADQEVRETMRAALAGSTDQTAFASLHDEAAAAT
jgi:hypothetical protein